MKLPKRIQIGSLTYRVRRSDVLLGSDNQALSGEIKYDELEIGVIRGLSGDRAREVLMHEVVHGISDVFSSGLNEEQTDRMAQGICMVLSMNPGLVELFRER